MSERDGSGSGANERGADGKGKGKERPTNEIVEQVSKALAALPNKSAPSRRAMVSKLSEEIEAAKDRGYTLSEVREVMSENGLHIALSTLRGYVRGPTRPGRSRGAKKEGARKRGSDPGEEG